MTTADDLAKRLQQFERRLENLERPNRLDRSSLTIDDAGTTLKVRQALLDSPTLPLRAAQALQDAINPTDVIDGNLTVYFGGEIPTAPNQGDLWLAKGTVVMWYNTGAWNELPETELGSILAEYGDALITADGRIETYWTVDPPVVGAVGDFWYRDAGLLPHRWDGSQWVSLVPIELQSTNYVQGEQGLIFRPDGGAQLQQLQVIDALSASSVSVAELLLAGDSLTDILSVYPRGLVVSANRGGGGSGINAGPTSTTTPLRVMRLTAGPVSAGRALRVKWGGMLNVTVQTDAYEMYVTYTTDGSDPVSTSAVIPGSRLGMPGSGAPARKFQSFQWDVILPVTADWNLKLALFLQRTDGTGTAAIYLAGTSDSYQFQWTVEDIGLASEIDNTALSQTAKSDGTGEDNPPVGTYTKTFYPTWAQSYTHYGDRDPAGGTYDQSSKLWVGLDSANYIAADFPYGMLSLIGFNSTAIQSALSSASSFISCKLYWRQQWKKDAANGLDMRLVSHAQASSPATVGINWNDDASYQRHSLGVNNGANGTTYVADYGTTVAAQFKSGARKGCGFYGFGTSTPGYGYLYGMGSSRPYLVISYKGTS